MALAGHHTAERPARRPLTTLALAAVVMLATAAAALAAAGALTQPRGKAGCVSADGSHRCANGHGLADGVDAVAVSPDNKSVYATSHTAVARFKRNRHTGAIPQPAGKGGCVSEDGSGRCADGHALSGVAWVAVSPDGRSVYAASTISNAIVR